MVGETDTTSPFAMVLRVVIVMPDDTAQETDETDSKEDTGG
jgi:hypothetical protein